MNTNTVDVDPAALLAEANRAVAGAPMDSSLPSNVDGGAGAGIDPAPATQSWRPLIEGLTPTVRMTIFAQWNIAPDMQLEFIGSLSQSLDLLFPGGLEGKYAPLARLLCCSAGIVFMNYTANGGKLPPLGLKKPDDKKPAGNGEQRTPA